jgi:hypothetical protein
MSKELEVYKKWAPDTALWTQWVKPVVFMNMNVSSTTTKGTMPKNTVSWTDYQADRMLIVDLPSDEGIKQGLALATIGYRPIPLYNGVPGGRKAVVSNQKIVEGLSKGAEALANIELSNKANPAFLLDSNRLKGNKKKPGTFDNRWCVVVQDMPSANYLKRQGIKEIVVRTEGLQKDLSFILYHYQKQGISIYLCGSQERIKLKKVPKPKNIRLFYRFLLLLGFTRGATGGFGMTIPEVSSGGGGYRAG